MRHGARAQHSGLHTTPISFSKHETLLAIWNFGLHFVIVLVLFVLIIYHQDRFNTDGTGRKLAKLEAPSWRPATDLS